MLYTIAQMAKKRKVLPELYGPCLRSSGEAGTKLYCLVTEAHVCEQLA